jgi:hypothetical protein
MVVLQKMMVQDWQSMIHFWASNCSSMNIMKGMNRDYVSILSAFIHICLSCKMMGRSTSSFSMVTKVTSEINELKV